MKRKEMSYCKAHEPRACAGSTEHSRGWVLGVQELAPTEQQPDRGRRSSAKSRGTGLGLPQRRGARAALGSYESVGSPRGPSHWICSGGRDLNRLYKKKEL